MMIIVGMTNIIIVKARIRTLFSATRCKAYEKRNARITDNTQTDAIPPWIMGRLRDTFRCFAGNLTANVLSILMKVRLRIDAAPQRMSKAAYTFPAVSEY